MSWEWNGEEWEDFHAAAHDIGDKLVIPSGPALARLRQLCASGEVRAILSDADDEEQPEPIPPSRWRSEDVDLSGLHLVTVSMSDLRHWLAQQPDEAEKEKRAKDFWEKAEREGRVLRGDDHECWEHDLFGERWLIWARAIVELGDKLAIPPSAAHAQLHKLCASGQVRAIGTDDPEGSGVMPEPIPPSQWADDDRPMKDVLVSNTDFYSWLGRQLSHAAGGKQSRIARLLGELFPTGVPNRADCPREPLKAKLLKRDPSLEPLDLKTLKTAIDAYNRQLGNARNTSVSD
jgi:hypothetical protein